MASSRPAITAHPQRWELFGALLEARRRNLGYATRASFERGRQVQAWLIVAFENATRRSISPGRLRALALAYGFTYESALALLNDKADELAFVPLGPVPALPAPERERRAPRRKRRAVTPDPQRPIEEAPPEGRKLLGVLLAQRRAELGYTHRPAFTRARLPLTPSGNPNTRLVADIEEAYRDNFPDPRLRQLARAYLVDYRSLLDVAHLRRNTLIPVSPDAAPAALPIPAGPPGWLAAEEGRSEADRPYADRIRGRLDLLRLQGVTAPSGAQLFGEGTEDARIWDKYAEDWAPWDVAWFVADFQRREAERGSGPEANSHGALCRGNVAGRWLMRHLPGTAVMVTVYISSNACARARASHMTEPWGLFAL
jgi:hypothetical protein